MTEVQEKLLELLTDIDDICNREDIKYYLCLETAHAALVKKVFHSKCCQASVAMTPDDALKFVAAVKRENRADRITDSMLNNKNYPDFTVRYGDPNTMMIQLPYNPVGVVPCIAVTIHMIRYKPKFSRKFYKRSKKFWKACRKPISSYSGFTARLAATACHVIKKIFGEANISRWLFKKWCAIFSANKKAKAISVCAGKYVYDPVLLEYEDTVQLEDKEFRVFGYVDAYLRTAYGSTFRKTTPKYTKPSSTLLISKYVPYKEYLKRAKEMDLDFAAIRRNKKKYDKLRATVAADNKKIDQYYAIVDRTEKRFAMYEKYMPMKKLLMQLHEEERYKELNELLKPYRSALWACYKKNLALCFDKDIFEITMNILRREGSYTYVKKLRKMVPEHHWEPMVVTDYKGELVEIEDISELFPESAENIEEPAE